MGVMVPTWWRGDPADILDAMPSRPDWWARARCRGQGAPGFTIARHNPTPYRVDVCATCPVRPECARTALALIDSHVLIVGLWAGVVLRASDHGGRREAVAALRAVAEA